MKYTADVIPAHFWHLEYDQNHDRNSPILPSILQSPNCQNFAYALLQHFGYSISPFRSSDLWVDTRETLVVTDELAALDLLLFNRTSNPWGAHVALHLGKGAAIHLCKKESKPVIWSFPEFQTLPEYRTFIGAKRLRELAGTS